MTPLDKRWQRNFDRSQARQRLKERAIAFLGGKCVICSYDRCPSAMDFHHTDSREKDFTISGKESWAAIENELKKCVLLCSNCHRETHAGLHPKYLQLEVEGRDAGYDDFDLS